MKKKWENERYDELHSRIRKRKRGKSKRRKKLNEKGQVWAMDCKKLIQEPAP